MAWEDRYGGIWLRPNQSGGRACRAPLNSSIRPLTMSESQPEAMIAKLSDSGLVKLAAQPGLSTRVAAAVALEQAKRSISPADLESYRAQVLEEYAGAKEAMLRKSLFSAPFYVASGVGILLFGAMTRSVVCVILGLILVLAGRVTASSAKAKMAALRLNR